MDRPGGLFRCKDLDPNGDDPIEDVEEEDGIEVDEEAGRRSERGGSGMLG